jgi:Glycosyl transferase family 2
MRRQAPSTRTVLGVCRLLRFIVEPGARVLSVRCGTGDVLDAVSPSYGVGVEGDQALVDLARARYPRFTFVTSDPEHLELQERFDYILVDDLPTAAGALASLTRLVPLCEPHARVVICGHDRLPEDDVRGLLQTAGFHVVRTHRRSSTASVVVARPAPRAIAADSVGVSVVVPCRNERGNVAAAVARMPRLGRHTEIVFCDDRSTDGTGDEIRRMQALHPDRDIRLVEGPGVCKAENVWAGFRASRGDILIILDADLTVMPEELPNFVLALTDGRGEFINGSRMVHPMSAAAMSLSHVAGNRMMSRLFSYLLDHRVTDTLCGTKALWRRDWARIEKRLGSWGVHDRWGDHELLLGAARLQLAIVDMPVHYQARVFGASKMRVPSNLFRMLRMCAAAAPRLKGGA